MIYREKNTIFQVKSDIQNLCLAKVEYFFVLKPFFDTTVTIRLWDWKPHQAQ